MSELNALNSTVEEIIAGSNACNDESFTALSLTRFVDLRVFAVGNECFKNVDEVKLIGLSQLERVVIGRNCFSQEPASLDKNTIPQLRVKDCERLKELRIGRKSFCYYSVCEIDNNASLEVIEMGKMDEAYDSFVIGSLKVTSILLTRE